MPSRIVEHEGKFYYVILERDGVLTVVLLTKKMKVNKGFANRTKTIPANKVETVRDGVHFHDVEDYK